MIFFSLNRTGDKAYILFHDLARLIFSETLRKGLDYILEETYATTPEELKNDIDLFFESLAEAEEPVNKYGNRHLTLEQYQGVLDSKIDIPTKRHFSFSKLFPDTVVVNKSAAIRHLFNCGYPLQREVKGISQAIVDHITATPKTDTAKTPPDAAIAVSSSLWKGKSPQAIRNGMRDDGHSDAVIAFVLSEWCNKSKTLIGRLLSEEQDMADSSYRKLTTRLLAEAAAQTIIKFPPEDSPK